MSPDYKKSLSARKAAYTRAIKRLEAKALHAEDDRDRAAAVAELVRRYGALPSYAIEEALKDHSGRVRVAAIHAIGKMIEVGSDGSAKALLEMAGREDDEQVLAHIREVLPQTRHPYAIREIAVIARKGEGRMRQYAVDALRTIYKRATNVINFVVSSLTDLEESDDAK